VLPVNNLVGEVVTFGTSKSYDLLSKANNGKKVHVCNGSAGLIARTKDPVRHELEKHHKPEVIGLSRAPDGGVPLGMRNALQYFGEEHAPHFAA
jgi:hypothetical protein